MKKLLLLLMMASSSAFAQMPADGLMMPPKTLCTGFLYQRDNWKNYWEGSLKRDNQNIGELTTQNVIWYGVYGLSPKWNLMAMLPYVSTQASRGTLHGMTGLQDLSLAAKYKLLELKAGPGRVFGFVGGGFSTPLSDYNVDLFPLSIGMGSTTVNGRFNGNYTLDKGLYFNGSAAYTWRSNVTLDRPAYFTDGKYYSTDVVWMPNVFDYKLDVGYHKGSIQAELSYMQMITLGGGDIRRQDMPFVSNRMNASRIGALVMYYLPFPKNLGVRAAVNYTVAGRNAGQTLSLLGGLMYTIRFSKQEEVKAQTN